MTYLTRSSLFQTASPLLHQSRQPNAPRFGVAGGAAAASAAHAFEMRQAEERQRRQEMQQAVLNQVFGEQGLTGQDIYTKLVELQQQALETASTRMQAEYQQALSAYKSDQERISQLPLIKRPFQKHVPKPHKPSEPSIADNPIRIESLFGAYQTDQHEALQDALRAFVQAHLLAASEDSIQQKQGAAVTYGLA